MKPVVSLIKYDDINSVAKAIELCDGFKDLKPSDRVLLKPNICTAGAGFFPPFGTVTTTGVLEGTVRALKDFGVSDITIGEGDVMLRDAVLGLLNMGEQNIVLYLKNVGNVDSSGIGELLSVLTKVTERGGRLVLCAVPMVIHNLLAAEQIATVFEIYDTQEEAVQSFSEAK